MATSLEGWRVLCTLGLFWGVYGNQQEPGAYPITWVPTIGSPWPMPQIHTVSPILFSLNPENFEFLAPGFSCDILEAAFERYRFLTFPSLKASQRSAINDLKWKIGEPLITSLNVDVKESCSDKIYPSLESDESYTLYVDSDGARLTSTAVWGALRGLETFSQIVWQDDQQGYYVNKTATTDYPRFQHRGTLLDTGRHYLSLQKIKEHIELMAQSKLNVFHWHIVDDQSFPYQSYTFPALSEKAAWSPTHVYTLENIKDIIEFARVRGIRVIPEFDSPGHSLSWGKGQPGLLTPCYTQSEPNGNYGPIDPSRNTTYQFLSKLFTEIATVFPDKYLHMGGDEVSFQCWMSNPLIKQFMAEMDFGTDYSKLEGYYIQNLLNIIGSLQKGYLVWQEVVNNGVKVGPETVVHVWLGNFGAQLAQLTRSGYRAVLSSCWYLNRIHYGPDWTPFYQCDPHNFNGTEEQKKLVVGGEACMWGEFVDDTNMIPLFWPRASVVAERLWSPQNLTDLTMAARRVTEHRCRLLRRGFPVEPMGGPNYCKYEVPPYQ